MKRIVFFCIPAWGHTNPTLGVVRELVSRGHSVWYYSYEALRRPIEEAGAIFRSCDAYDCQQKLSARDGVRLAKDLAFSTAVLARTTLALDPVIRRDLEAIRPHCIVADSMAVWGKLAARKYGIPFVCSTTTFAFNRHSSRIMKQSPWALVRMLTAMPGIQRQVRTLQRAGFPIRSILDIIQNDNETHTIVYTAPEFQPCAETFSDRYAFVGPILRPAREGVEKRRERLVYISMGTVNNDMLPLYRALAQAFGAGEHQLILSLGDRVDPADLGPLPAHIQAWPRVDQMAVLEKADVFVTHCGMNSVSEALALGVPLVLLPQTPEQEGVARRVEQLGAGLRPGDASGDAIREAAQQVLSEPGYGERARELARYLNRCPGAAGAADKILACCR